MPHWYTTNATYFVTFSLFDAIPIERAEEFRAEKRIRLAELERLRVRATPAELHAIEEVMRERVEQTLDRAIGSCFMNDSRVAKLVATAITFFDGDRYQLCSWCVMPNHVHVVLNPRDPIDRIIHSWKSYTSKEANKILQRTGKFWQEDYYDHLIRTPQELERTNRYVLDNPINAGLVNWEWLGQRAFRAEAEM